MKWFYKFFGHRPRSDHWPQINLTVELYIHPLIDDVPFNLMKCVMESIVDSTPKQLLCFLNLFKWCLS